MKTNYRPHNGLDEMIRRNENRKDANRITPRMSYPLVFPGTDSKITIRHDGNIKTIIYMR